MINPFPSIVFVFVLISILPTKTTAARNAVALSYHRVRGLYFLAVVFAATIVDTFLGSHTELRSARNFEAHGTSKRTELRSTRNFEAHGTSKMSSKLLCILLYLNPYYCSYLTP